MIQRGSGMRAALRSEGNYLNFPVRFLVYSRDLRVHLLVKVVQNSIPPTVDQAILKDPSTTLEDSQTFTYLMVGGQV